MTSHAVGNLIRPASGKRSWSTSSYPDASDTTPAELSSLIDHVDHCNGSRGRWFAVKCAADSMYAFIAPRFVTTIVLVSLAIGIASFVV